MSVSLLSEGKKDMLNFNKLFNLKENICKMLFFQLYNERKIAQSGVIEYKGRY